MRAITHVATGGAIAATIGSPWLALPVAFAAHFVMDALPHFGESDNPSNDFARQRWLLPLDAFACIVLAAIILSTGSDLALLAIAGGFACASPDLLQIPRYLRFLHNGRTAPGTDWFSQFHHKIQWCERRWALAVEVPFLIGALWVLFANL